MSPSQRPHGLTSNPDWPARQRYWQRKLKRLRLNAEPIEVQVARYRRVTWMLSAVACGLAAVFVALFSAFRRPDVGLVLAGVLFLPVVGLAWLDYAVLATRAERYRRERDRFEGGQAVG
jgi:hypothetical protein